MSFRRPDLRGITALVAVLWALSALVLAIVGQVSAERAFYTPIATSGAGGVVVVHWRDEAAAAEGVAIGDRVLSVDGQPINSWYRSRGWERAREGVPIDYALERRDGSVHRVALMPLSKRPAYARVFLPLFGANLAVGIAYLALGLLVWRLKPGLSESHAFLLFCSTMAMQLWTSVHAYDAPWGYERMQINLPLLGATTFHLFTTLPREPAWVLRHPGVRLVPYVAAGLIAVAVLCEGLLRPPPDLLPHLSLGCSLGFAAIAIGVLIHERFRAGGDGSGRAGVVFFGALLSFVPASLMILLQLLFRIPFPTALALLWFSAFPVAVAYGIVRRELFDIRGAARSSAAYGAATLAITGLFAFLITFADALFQRFGVTDRSTWFSVAFLFLAILAFNPLRNRLQALVDRMFDRDRAGYRNAVREISEAMVSMLSLREVGERLLAALTDTMGVERAMVLLQDEDELAFRASAWRGEWEREELPVDLPVDHAIAKQLWMRRQELTRLDFDGATDAETRESCRDVFDTLEVELLVPILFGVDLLGVIAVGRKLNGERLGVDDRQLLRTLANQSAIAIENARAFDEIAKLNETLEARVEERTRELQHTQAQLLQSEKMRSLGQLVAGVAHELNNPIGFVHANLQLLEGYVGKLLEAREAGESLERIQEAISKLLSRSREGTQRVKKIVEDLRAFSRMDRAELAEADLNDEIDRTLGLMEPRLKGGIAVEREFGEIPRVRCFAAQLNQVFMNLCMNSCDALQGKGTIRIRTGAIPGGVRLEFSDDGPGIPEEIRGRIFEPFFTTKQVGEGTGLGLSISHGIVERNGGTMSVHCPASGGTVFVVELPLAATPLESASVG